MSSLPRPLPKKSANIQDETGARRVHRRVCPLWLQERPKRQNSLIVDEEAAEVVKSIYHWFVNEGYSKMGIAKRLNQMGEPNPEAYKKKKALSITTLIPTKTMVCGLPARLQGYCKMKFIRA
ncbi:MAG: recombinase family protein [Oscillospiraceae bacterium]